MNKSGYLLAEVALEVASHWPDEAMNITRSQWRQMIVDNAIKIIDEHFIDDATEDIDEIVAGALAEGE